MKSKESHFASSTENDRCCDRCDTWKKRNIDIKKALNGEKIEFTMAKAEFLTLNNIEYENIVIEKVKNERNMRKNTNYQEVTISFGKNCFSLKKHKL